VFWDTVQLSLKLSLTWVHEPRLRLNRSAASMLLAFSTTDVPQLS
jgi:hypothetical protein